MRKIVRKAASYFNRFDKRKLCSLILMFLSTSTSFVSAFNSAFVVSATAQNGAATGTCAAVAEREADWPIVQYCAEPAVVGTDNQFYVYVKMNSTEPEFAQIELLPKGINVQQVEPLTPDMVSFVDGKIVVRSTGQFIIHGNPATCAGLSGEQACNEANCEWRRAYCGDQSCLYEEVGDCEAATDCTWNYYKNHCYKITTECSSVEIPNTCAAIPECAWQQEHCSEPEYQLKLTSTNKKVQLSPVEKCIDLVSFMLYVEEAGTQKIIDVKSPLDSFAGYVWAGFLATLSQVPKEKGAEIPPSMKERLVQFNQEVDWGVEGGALLLVKNNEIVDLVDLKGQRAFGWMPNRESAEIAGEFLDKVDAGEYDGVILYHTHHAVPEIVKIYMENGIDLKYLALPSIADHNGYETVKSMLFRGRDVPYLIGGALSEDALAKGDIIFTFSKILPDIIDPSKLTVLGTYQRGIITWKVIDPRQEEAMGSYERLFFGDVGDRLLVSYSPSTRTKTVNLPELFLRAAQDEVGEDNVVLSPRGPQGYAWGGEDIFPYDWISDLEYAFIFDDSVFTSRAELEQRILKRFKAYATSIGLTVDLDFERDVPLVVTFLDGKVIPYDKSITDFMKNSEAPDRISFGREPFVGAEKALAKLGTVLAASGISESDIVNRLSDTYAFEWTLANGWVERTEPRWALTPEHLYAEGPEKAYKKLALLSYIKGEAIEIRRLFLERYDYWRKIFLDEYASAGRYSTETLETFRQEISPHLEVDYYPFEPTRRVFSSKVAEAIHGNIEVTYVASKSIGSHYLIDVYDLNPDGTMQYVGSYPIHEVAEKYRVDWSKIDPAHGKVLETQGVFLRDKTGKIAAFVNLDTSGDYIGLVKEPFAVDWNDELFKQRFVSYIEERGLIYTFDTMHVHPGTDLKLSKGDLWDTAKSIYEAAEAGKALPETLIEAIVDPTESSSLKFWERQKYKLYVTSTEKLYEKILEFPDEETFKANVRMEDFVVGELTPRDWSPIYKLKNSISRIFDIEVWDAPIDEDVNSKAEAVTRAYLRSSILRRIYRLNKNINEAIDKKDLTELTKLQGEASRIKNSLYDGLEGKEEMLQVVEANERLITASKASNGELTPELEAKIRETNAVGEPLLNGQLKAASDIGEVSKSLSDDGNKPTLKGDGAVVQADDSLTKRAEEVESLLEHPARKRAAETIDAAQGSKIEEVPQEIKSPFESADFRFKNVLTGYGLTAFFSIGPKMEELGKRTRNMKLLIASDVVRVSGLAVLALLFTQAYATTHSVLTALAYTVFIVKVDVINIFSIGKGGLMPDPVGFIVFITTQIIINYLWCAYVDPTSTACGCSANPAYGKMQMDLSRTTVDPGGGVGFSIYGMQHCAEIVPPQQAYYATIEYYDESTTEWKSIHNEVVYPLTDLPEEFKCKFDYLTCDTCQGRCCNANLDLSKTVLQTGTYRIRGRFCRISEGELSEGDCCMSAVCQHDYERCNSATCRCEYIEPYHCYSDSAYITEEKTLTIGGAAEELTSIELKPGWNMISTPYSTVTFDTSSCTLFSKAYHYHPTASSIYDTIDVGDMEGGMGYWVYSYNECEIKLSGQSDPIEAPTNLGTGWNQIAIPLDGLERDRVQCDQIEDPKTWNTETNSWVFVENMVPGKSYFVDCYPAH